MQDDKEPNLGPDSNPEPSFYHEDSEPSESAPQITNHKEVSWTASEFIAHHKSPLWYLVLAAVTVLFAVLAYYIVDDRLTIVAIVVGAITFGFFASRQPQTLPYAINAHGIAIGDKLYPYAMLRTFSIQQEGAISSIVLIPLRRFMPSISLYYPPDQEEEILDTLSNYLPHEERRPDLIDRLMRRIRF